MTNYTTNDSPVTLVGALNTLDATVSAGAVVVFNLTGIAATFDIHSNSGSSVTINNTVDVASTINLETNGGGVNIGTLAGTTATYNVTVDAGGQFTAGGTFLGLLNSSSIVYSGTGGTVVLGTSNNFVNLSFAPHIDKLTSGSDVIDERELKFNGVTGYKVTGSTGHVQTVTISDSAGDFSFNTSGSDLTVGKFTSANLNAGTLQFSSDGVGGTLITVCFLRGTRIATPDGERLIEALKVNDLVITADGHTVPIRWIGVNTISTRFADPMRNLPIRIRAGALADQVPVRDLLVSPGHAMFIDGLLIHAGALVNGVTVTRETAMPETFVYYHVELENHDLILAEGAAAETFIDNIDRMAFDNWADRQEIVGEGDPIVELDLPRVKSARQLPPRVRALLAARQAFLVQELAAAA